MRIDSQILVLLALFHPHVLETGIAFSPEQNSRAIGSKIDYSSYFGDPSAKAVPHQEKPDAKDGITNPFSNIHGQEDQVENLSSYFGDPVAEYPSQETIIDVFSYDEEEQQKAQASAVPFPSARERIASTFSEILKREKNKAQASRLAQQTVSSSTAVASSPKPEKSFQKQASMSIRPNREKAAQRTVANTSNNFGQPASRIMEKPTTSYNRPEPRAFARSVPYSLAKGSQNVAESIVTTSNQRQSRFSDILAEEKKKGNKETFVAETIAPRKRTPSTFEKYTNPMRSAPAVASDVAPIVPNFLETKPVTIERTVPAPLVGAPITQEKIQAPNIQQAPGVQPPSRGIWDTAQEQIVQGRTLKTWTYSTKDVDRVQFALKTDGRPLNANIELWEGPDNTPQKLKIFVEDGYYTTFTSVMATQGSTNTIGIRNTGPMEFPAFAAIQTDKEAPAGAGLMAIAKSLTETDLERNIIQGQSVLTFPFEEDVNSVSVYLKTDGRPLTAKIELLQGPNNIKQEVEVYTEDGLSRPFFAVMEMPDVQGHVVRVVNMGTIEFPLSAHVEPYLKQKAGLIQRGPIQWEKRGTGFFFAP